MTPGTDLGIVRDRRQKSEAVIAANADRLSQSTLHALNPQKYARPVPLPQEANVLRAEVFTLSTKCRDLEIENEQLKRRITKMVTEVEEFRLTSLSRVLVAPQAITVANVMRLYLKALERADHLLDGTPYTAQDLVGPRRARASAWPRAIGMWLCRRLCKSTSLPTIGKAFGGRDHTTVMHACARAQHIMDNVPSLKAAALVVLASFEESAGGP